MVYPLHTMRGDWIAFGDPLLIWNYAVVAILAFLGGIGFWFTWRSLDAREDELNMLQASQYLGRKGSIVDDEKMQE